jgi:hypothetical protein
LDFGWGKPVFGGPVYPFFGGSFFTAFTDRNGEDAVVVPIALPRQAMTRFAEEMVRLFVSKLYIFFEKKAGLNSFMINEIFKLYMGYNQDFSSYT